MLRGNAKNRKRTDVLLRDDAVAELRKIRPRDVKPLTLVWGKKGVLSMDLFREHLAAAGIPEVDERGHVFKFHSTRKTFYTMLAVAGVGEATHMKMMRVSDRRLIDRTYLAAAHLPHCQRSGFAAAVRRRHRRERAGRSGRGGHTERHTKFSPALSSGVGG